MKLGIALILIGIILAILFIMVILAEIEDQAPTAFSLILLIIGGIAPIAIGGWRIRRIQSKK